MKKKVSYLLILFYFTNSFSISQYFIALKKNTGDLHAILNDLSNYAPLIPPSNKYFADPFLFKYEGVNYIFYEDFDYKKGRIAYVTVDEDLNFSESKTVLDLKYHISFPYIFKENDKIYMIPETSKAHEIALFEASPFPNNWKKVKTLIKGNAYSDTILFKHEEYYWLFTANWTDLCIFYSKNLFSEFKPHPINKKKIPGRNAGNIFEYKGKFIRPVMNCTPSYGYNMTLKEIITLSPSEFLEENVTTINPDWAPQLNGTHTFNCNNDLIVYDGRKIS